MAGTLYPLFIDTLAQLPKVVDGISPVRADDVNRIRDAVVAVEKELGINPSGTYATVRDRLDALTALLGNIPSGSGEGTSILFDFISVGLETPADKTYYVVNGIPYDGYIFNVTSQCSVGTATATTKINGVALGGGSNSVSTIEQTILHTTARDLVVGDDITLEISSSAGIADLILTIIFARLIDVPQSEGASSSDLDGYVRATTGPVQNTSVPVFDGLTGKFIKRTGVTIDTYNNVLGPASLAVNTAFPSSTFHAYGSFSSKVASIFTPGSTLGASDHFILADASGGNIIITLPVASTCAHRHYFIKRIDSSTNVVAITRSGADLIDNAASTFLNFQYEVLSFVSNGSNWFIY